MKTYLVGGAVRDSLLGLPVTEKDYVVVGTTPDEMKALGYTPVGRDFPVFLHPDSRAEYALARTERKTGPGHTGFTFHTDPDVTLEEDLYRRDLTINAMARREEEGGTGDTARASTSELIDPWGGQQDLDARLLRHVSAAFSEDPLRILRIARFKAKLQPFGFEIAPETQQLLKDMVTEQVLTELSADRIIAEVDKALATPSPATFFYCLDELGAAQQLWPEISREDVDRLAASTAASPEARFATLVLTRSEADIEQFTRRLHCSNLRRELCLMAVRLLARWTAFDELSAEDICAFLVAADAVRKRDRFIAFARIADDMLDTQLGKRWQDALQVMASVRVTDIASPKKGPALGEQIREEQVRQLDSYLSQGRES